MNNIKNINRLRNKNYSRFENKKFSFKALPSDLSCTNNRNPKISIYIEDKHDIHEISRVNLFVDGKKVDFQLTSDLEIMYTPVNDMSYGEHVVKFLIYDNKNNIFKGQWKFFVVDKEKEYHIYYGVPHAHTSYSDGKKVPTEAYEHARDKKLQFLIVTDHVGKIIRTNSNYDDTILLYGGKYPKWEMTKIEAEAINAKYKDFIALAGFELSTTFWGHINIINSGEMVNKRKFDVEDLSQWLIGREDVIISVNHPFKKTKKLLYSKDLDKVINLIEVGNGAPPRIYTRCEEIYYKTLDEGWHVGAINGQDNHSDNWGDRDNLTAVIAEELSVESLLSAMRMRRVFSTESRTLQLIFKVNGYWMGSILDYNRGDILDIQIKAKDLYNPIDKIEVISNGGKVIKEYCYNKVFEVEINDSLKVGDKNSWYLVKITHNNKKIAISSAVFIVV